MRASACFSDSSNSARSFSVRTGISSMVVTGTIVVRCCLALPSIFAVMVIIYHSSGDMREGADEPGRGTGRDACLLFLVAVLRRIAGGAVIFVRQELARHGDPDPVAAGIGLALQLHFE